MKKCPQWLSKDKNSALLTKVTAETRETQRIYLKKWQYYDKCNMYGV